MKKLEFSKMEQLEAGRPCIGTGHVTIEYANGCTMDCLQNYFLWIPTGGTHGCSTMVCPNGSSGL